MINRTLQEAIAYGCTTQAQLKRFAEIKQLEYEAEQTRLEHLAKIEAEAEYYNG